MRFAVLLLIGLLVLPLWAQEATEEPPTNRPPTEQEVEDPVQGDIPEPMPLVDEGGYNIYNILLVGASTNTNSSNPGLTDAIMVVSLNKDTGSVSVVSLPRDLWVYAPDFGMVKINQVYFFAERKEAGSGVALLKEMMKYNLGLEIDYYARVNFDSFPSLIDSFGGVEITVDCAIQDWQLKQPGIDQTIETNWVMVTLPAGRHTLNGFTALWYVRSRRTSSDIDRGRRQQDMLRALYRKIRAEGLLENFPALWEQLNQLVVTDITLPDALNLLPIAINTDTSGVQYYTMRLNEEIKEGLSQDEGRFILIMNREEVAKLMQNVVLPPTSSQIARTIPTVAVVNASGARGMGYVAADRLELEGFRPIVLEEEVPRQTPTSVIDYTGLDKDNPIDSIVSVMRIDDGSISVEADTQRDYDYRVVVGSDYRFRSCTRPVQAPIDIPDPTPEAPTGEAPVGEAPPVEATPGS
jgi:LCP family protein required for cell wall assembly